MSTEKKTNPYDLSSRHERLLYMVRARDQDAQCDHWWELQHARDPGISQKVPWHRLEIQRDGGRRLRIHCRGREAMKESEIASRIKQAKFRKAIMMRERNQRLKHDSLFRHAYRVPPNVADIFEPDTSKWIHVVQWQADLRMNAWCNHHSQSWSTRLKVIHIRLMVSFPT